MSSDGTGNMVAPATEGAELAMRRALDHAGVSPDEIDYINTHGTSTPVGDVSEVRAIRKVFGERPVAYSSTKGYTGHPVSAAGAIEAVFTLAMLRGGWIAPCVNVDSVDPELEDYPPVLEPVSRELSLALSNSFGFGGTNATLVLGRA
jgi:3-oxoacyl-[acyl-carrier-protein] synthase-1